jgi:hypothetical protein
MRLVKRSDWGAARARGRERLDADRVRGVALHYSGMNSDEQANHRNCAGRVRSMQRYHMEERRWLDVAYNQVVCVHGYVFVGRGFGVRSAANGTKAANDRFFAVCSWATTAGVGRTSPRRRSPRSASYFARTTRRIPRAMRVRPHSDFVATPCPGDELRAYIARKAWISTRP